MTEYRAKFETTADPYTKKTVKLSKFITNTSNLMAAYRIATEYAKVNSLTLLSVDES